MTGHRRLLLKRLTNLTRGAGPIGTQFSPEFQFARDTVGGGGADE